MLKAWVCFYSQWSSVISLLSFWNLHPIKQAYILSCWMSWGYFNETVTPALHFKALILSPFVSTLKHAPSVSLLADLTIYFSSTFFFALTLYSSECTISSERGCLFVLLPFSSQSKFTFSSRISPWSCLQTIFLGFYCPSLFGWIKPDKLVTLAATTASTIEINYSL